MATSLLIAWAIRPGNAISSWTSRSSSARVRTPRARPAAMARLARVANWQVKALVEATPISGPATVRATRSLSRAMVDVGTFTTERMVWPCCLA